MLVSVIIPCFNSEKTIIEAVSSVLSQTYDAVEVIIVNDGSTDNSLNVVESYIKNNKEIKSIYIFSKPNQGPSAARNFGVNFAKGEFLVFLDADDKLHETYIEKCVKVYEKLPELNIVYSNAEFFGVKNKVWRLNDYDPIKFLTENCIPIFAMIRKDVFLKVGRFDENLKYIEDWELWIRILREFNGVYKIPEVLFYYRKSEDKKSLTDINAESSNSVLDNSLYYVYNKHYSHYRNNKLSIFDLINCLNEGEKYKYKYYNVWYRKYFYKIFNKRKYRLIYSEESL